jgi:hypothetical protein
VLRVTLTISITATCGEHGDSGAVPSASDRIVSIKLDKNRCRGVRAWAAIATKGNRTGKPRTGTARGTHADYGRLTTMPSCEDDRPSVGGRPDNGPLSLLRMVRRLCVPLMTSRAFVLKPDYFSRGPDGGQARTSKPPRWSADCRLSACSGSSLSRRASLISSVSDGRPTALQPRHGIGKTWAYGLHRGVETPSLERVGVPDDDGHRGGCRCHRVDQARQFFDIHTWVGSRYGHDASLGSRASARLRTSSR